MIKKIIKKLLRTDNVLSRFSARTLRKYRIREFEKKEFKVLEISGGSRPLSRDYLNIDISNDVEVDLVTNLLEPIPLPDSYCDKIVTVATLEHFNVNDVRTIIKEFYRLLKPGGVLEIGVPALNKIFEQYKIHGCNDEVLRYLHGGLKDKYDIHFFVVDSVRFIQELSSYGFVNSSEVKYDFPRHSIDFMMKIIAEKPR